MSSESVVGYITQAEPWHSTGVPLNPSLGLQAAWSSSLGEDGSRRLERRLEWERLDHNELHPTGRSRWKKQQSNSRSCWQHYLELCISDIRKSATELHGEPIDQHVDANTSHQNAFVDLWRPAADGALRRLRSDLEEKTSLQIAESGWQGLRISLLDRLCNVGEQGLWYCFSRIRPHGAILLAHLTIISDSSHTPPREYYESFIDYQKTNGLHDLLVEFPVLARLLGTTVALWHKSSYNMLIRINSDRTLLEESFFDFHNLLEITRITQGLSDPHRGGETVSILSFGEGFEKKSIVYKPKDMAIDAVYQALLIELNKQSHLESLKTLRVVHRQGYGYMELVDHRTCTSDLELKSFYHNAGRLTAILFLLGCTDCHHENLIAHGDQLVLIDTETLFEPDFIEGSITADTNKDRVKGLHNELADSVLRTGLLPHWMFIGDKRIPVDISALGISPPLIPTMSATGWLALNTDGMMCGEIMIPSKLPTSSPVDIGQPNKFSLFIEDFVQGFRDQTEAIASLRFTLLRESGLLAQFVGLPRRIVLRATRIYYAIQRSQLSPAAMRSSQAQGLVLEKLARTYLLSSTKPIHWALFHAEVAQMEQLDIPFFENIIDSDSIPLPSGIESIKGLILSSGLEACRERISSLNKKIIDFQCLLIKGAMQAQMPRKIARDNRLSTGNMEILASSNTTLKIKHYSASERKLLAQKILSSLYELAIVSEDQVPDWLGIDLGSDGEKFTFGSVGQSLYGGSSGVALFQAALGSFDERYSIYTNGFFKQLINLALNNEIACQQRWWRDQMLGLAGSGGIILSLLEMDRLLAPPPIGVQSHRELAILLMNGLSEDHIYADRNYDLIGGVTGLIGPLLRLEHSHAEALAVRCGEHLLSNQLENGGWPRRNVRNYENSFPLTGFSHGTAGMIAALNLLYCKTADIRFLEAAQKALRYERASFNKVHGNWPDYRTSESGSQFMSTWCHGAPGIALSRLCLMATGFDDTMLASDLDVALETISVQNLPNDHLCCGMMGLVSILRTAAMQGLGEKWQECADRLEQTSLTRAIEGQLQMFGTSEGGLLLPGMMTGLSGIGLSILGSPASQSCLSQILSCGLLTVY